jgi:hypothetical protein
MTWKEIEEESVSGWEKGMVHGRRQKLKQRFPRIKIGKFKKLPESLYLWGTQKSAII